MLSTVRRSFLGFALVSAVSVSLAGCVYKSMAEAKAACDQWVKEGGTFVVKANFYLGEDIGEVRPYLRSCFKEAETRQFLGLDDPRITEGQVFQEAEDIPQSEDVVVRSFKW